MTAPTFSGDDSTTVSDVISTLRVATNERQRLLSLIAAQQQSCRQYLAKVRPRFAALTILNLATGALAAAVAAGPGIGGSSFVDHAQFQLNVSDGDLLYQVLCAIAFAMSLTAVITANIIRAHDFSAKIAAAEGCYSDLECLRVQLLFATVSLTRGAEIFAKAAARVPFVVGEDTPRYERSIRSRSHQVRLGQ
jgi:hypothetical protein